MLHAKEERKAFKKALQCPWRSFSLIPPGLDLDIFNLFLGGGVVWEALSGAQELLPVLCSGITPEDAKGTTYCAENEAVVSCVQNKALTSKLSL